METSGFAFGLDGIPILTTEQKLRQDCLAMAVFYHAGNPNVTMTSGGLDTVARTSEKFYSYVKDGF